MWWKKFISRFINTTPKGCYIRAYRPEGHPKGAKFLLRMPLGSAVPKGVILGKGTVIDVET